jgi:hypothetical protein
MVRSLARAAAVAILGAMAGAVCLVLAFVVRDGFALEMDRDLPSNISGIYPPEREGERTFAWTSGRAELALDGLDRRVAWVCVLRVRGGRPGGHAQPIVDVSADGVRLSSGTTTNEHHELEVTVPPRERDGLALTIEVSPTMVPGPGDPRALGVQLDRLACRPAAGGMALPPRRAIANAMIAASAFGAGLALLNLTAVSAVGATILIAAGQGVVFSIGLGTYGAYGTHAVRLAVWIALATVVAACLLQRLTEHPLRNTARFVVAFAAAVLYLKLLGLLHPWKLLVDAVFQAHRLEWVLDGRYFFTQPMPGGVQFPYAIALYVVAAPWSLLTDDFVTLLRVVVCVFEAIAGALLYVMVVRTRGDRLEGAVAAALFALVPMAFWYTGNANLTAVFGQTTACIAVVAATTLSLQSGRLAEALVLTALIALAMLSHVSTFAILAFTLVSLAAAYWVLGGPALRTPARRILLATAIAVVVSVGGYYGHFADVYQRALHVRAATQAAAARAAPDPSGPGHAAPSLPGRTMEAMRITTQAIGWPLLLLAGLGAWRFTATRRRDRLACAVIAWGAAFVVFVAVGLMRVDPRFQRYSFEFVGRVAFATYPAAAVLAGYGAVWAWRAGMTARVGSAAVLLAAIALAVREWIGWLAR